MIVVEEIGRDEKIEYGAILISLGLGPSALASIASSADSQSQAKEDVAHSSRSPFL